MKHSIRGISLDLDPVPTWDEPENLDFIDTLTNQDIFLDLGACDGRFSIYAAMKGIQAIAVEPEPKNFGSLLENTRRNGVEIKAFNVAVGDVQRTVSMLVGQNWAGGHMKRVKEIVGRRDTDTFDFFSKVQIEMIAVDDLDEANLVTALKVDIDGSENEFLVGADKTLSQPHTRKMLIELLTTDSRFDFILDKICSYGFLEKSRYLVAGNDLFNIWLEKPQRKVE